MLPAVSVVIAGGFLSQSAPVARFGPAKTAIPYLLLSSEQRRSLQVVIRDFEDIGTRLPPDYEVQAILHTGTNPALWRNGENLWVAASWIASLGSKVSHSTHASTMLFALATKVL